ncbi:MAG: hypothetical protein J6D35_04445, partial [Chryseobacterium sp.]|nr:hypothetical protein [Chryseobacterium sp.]
MKKILFTITLFSSLTAMAQVAIGKTELSKVPPLNTVTNQSISLEFYDGADNAKGLVLPWTSTVSNQPTTYNASTGAG